MSDTVTKPPVTLEFVCRVLSVFDEDGPSQDSLWWRTDGEYAPLTLFVKCSDLFVWGCADLEEVTPDNVAELERAAADVKAVTWDGNYVYADLLFCCRVRGHRPQKPCYKDLDEETWPLFDACGPAVG